MADFTTKLYRSVHLSMLAGQTAITTGSTKLKVLLTTAAYTPNENSHRFLSDVTGQIVGTGYTAGGQALANVTVSLNSTTGVVSIAADPADWQDSTLTDVKRFVLYDDTAASASAKPLIAHGVLETATSSTASNFTLNPQGGVWAAWSVD